jgi:AraC-like DNA-binding protein
MSSTPRPPPDPFVPSDEPLMWLAGVGEEIRRDESYYFDCRKRLDRPHVVFKLTFEGIGFHTRGDRRQLLPANSAWIDQIPGNFEYGFASESPRPYRFAYISMTGGPAVRWMKRIHQNFGHVLNFGSDTSVADQLRAIVMPNEQSGWLDRYQRSAMLYALLMQVHSVLMRSRSEQATRVRRATELIREHARDPRFSIGQLSGELDCSREHLARQFQEATGMSPLAYLSQVRLRLVANELRSGDEKLEAIARRCGFSSANYLCRMFRKRWGVTPAQYRETPGMMLIS